MDQNHFNLESRGLVIPIDVFFQEGKIPKNVFIQKVDAPLYRSR